MQARQNVMYLFS